MNDKIKIIRSAKSWIEGSAIAQLEAITKLEGVLAAVGLPDLHPGKGFPIGAAFVSEEWIYPFCVGNDIGCGISLWQLDLSARKSKKERLAKKLEMFEEQDIDELKKELPEHELNRAGVSDLGTIGGSNHFAEVQVVEKVHSKEQFEKLGLDEDKLMLVVHSGSRYLGESVLRKYVDLHKDAGVLATSEEGVRYLLEHNIAIQFGANNRGMINEMVCMALATEGRAITDICHNSLTEGALAGKKVWIHRKGAARSDQGVVLIPGSRGTLSYLVLPIGDQQSNLWSIAHGAGRKYGRNAIKERLKGKVNKDQLRQTRLGGLVICDDTELLYEEAPDGYKNIDTVINDLKEAGLIEVVATFKPLVTYKRWRKS